MNSEMDVNSTEPDSWEDQSDQKNVDQATGQQLSNSFSKLNVDATPFVPNIHAPVFVPSFVENNIKNRPESGNHKTTVLKIV